MTIHAYLFEAKSIQPYILDSGKLKDLVGASELVDALCGDALSDALRACGLHECPLPERGAFDESEIGDRIAFSRRAGGAFYAFSGNADSIARLAAFWPLAVQQYAPGLEFDQGRAQGEDAYAAFDAACGEPQDREETGAQSRDGLRQARSRALVELPQAGPLALRSQRTGRPAIELRATPDKDLEPLDARTSRQRRLAFASGQGSLVDKLAPPGRGVRAEHWPRNMEAREAEEGEKAGVFPFLGDNRYIAVVHADGNGLGQLLMRLKTHVKDARRDYLTLFYQLSLGIEQATESAARLAVERHLIPPGFDPSGENAPIPARPIVLGGDDLTMIVRADLALGFVRTFLAAFEEATRGPMGELAERGLQEIPDRLTAGAGIAYIKASQPFYLGARLAEGIAGAVKSRAKAQDSETPPSAVGWHRVTTAMIDDYGAVLSQELTTGPKGHRFRHSLGAYAIHPQGPQDGQKLPALDDLIALQRLMEQPDMARGPTRQLLTLVGQSPEQARAHYRRWSGLMRDPANKRQDVLNRFEDRIEALIGIKPDPWPYRPGSFDTDGFDYIGPLGDLHALMSVKSRTAVLSEEPNAEDPT